MQHNLHNLGVVYFTGARVEQRTKTATHIFITITNQKFRISDCHISCTSLPPPVRQLVLLMSIAMYL